MRRIETQEEAEAEARRRFNEHATQVRQNLEEAFLEALPGNHSAADAVMLAHLMTATDGYNAVQFISDWDMRPRRGWTTSMAFLASIDPGLIVPFAVEARHGDCARQLTVIIDRERPGERLPKKLHKENALIARGYRVISFTEAEILSDPENCRERVENVMNDMADDVLADAGVIRGSSNES